MKKIPVRVLKISHHADIVMECDDELEAHNGAIKLAETGQLKMEKGTGTTFLAITVKTGLVAIKGGSAREH